MKSLNSLSCMGYLPVNEANDWCYCGRLYSGWVKLQMVSLAANVTDCLETT